MSERLKMRTLARRAALACCLVVVAGYLSNVVTRPYCERDAMRGILAEMAGGQPVSVPIYVLPETAGRSERALAGLDVATIRCQKTGRDFDCFPWASVETSIAVPFLLVVRSEHVLFTTSGGGNQKTVLALFGARMTVRERGMWVA